jgi:hypothetical protein
MRKLLKSTVTLPRVMGARWAFCVEHRQHKGLNNRTENSHQPTRRRELVMKRFNRPGRHNDFCRFTIKSRTSSTSLIPNPSLPTSPVCRTSEPFPLGARYPRRALRPNSSLTKNRLLGPAFAQLDDTGVVKGVNRATRSLRIGRFVNEELFRSDLAAEKSERPPDYMTAGCISDTSGLFHSGLKLASRHRVVSTFPFPLTTESALIALIVDFG